jgi:hypothetical protein
MLRRDDSQVFKKYSQMKLQMKREALEDQWTGQSNDSANPPPQARGWNSFGTVAAKGRRNGFRGRGNTLE